MKEIKFDICKYAVTISIGGKKLKTRKEKEQECFEQLQHHVEQKPVIEVITLRKAFDQYILSREGELAASTLKSYAHIRDDHFASIMDTAVGSLTEAKVQAAFNEEIARGWAQKTLKNYKYVLMKVLDEVWPGFKPDIKITVDN